MCANELAPGKPFTMHMYQIITANVCSSRCQSLLSKTGKNKGCGGRKETVDTLSSPGSTPSLSWYSLLVLLSLQSGPSVLPAAW